MTIHLHPTATAGTSPVRPQPLGDAVVLDIGLDDLEVGTTRLARVDGRRVCVARTADGVFAVDHACPHEGYGLTQGSLDGNLLTCAWHNWKFDVRTGACELGQEDVPAHDVQVGTGGEIAVRLRRPDPDVERARLLNSLERAIERDYVGQIARDVARLLALDVSPAEIVAVGVRFGAPRAEYGWGHAIAALTDCLAMVDLFDGDQRAVPIVQGLSLVAHDERGRQPYELPSDAPVGAVNRQAFLDAVEREDLVAAQSLVIAAVRTGVEAAELHRWFVGACSAHLLSYGHGAIYTQKGFELLDLIGWDHAESVLGHLVRSLVTGTREDTLPYFRPFGRVLGPVEVDAIAEHVVVADLTADADATGALRAALLGTERADAASATLDALRSGVSLDAVLDTIIDVVSERLLRHDVANEQDLDDDFGWLDITHGITYAHAARALLARERANGTFGPAVDPATSRTVRSDLVRLVGWCAFLANWTGRHEWHTSVGPVAATTIDDDLHAAAAGSTTLASIGEDLQRRSLDDVHTAPIHVEHAIKTSRTAHLEAQRTGSGRVLAATARYFDGPRQERGVRATIHRSIEFVNGRISGRG